LTFFLFSGFNAGLAIPEISDRQTSNLAVVHHSWILNQRESSILFCTAFRAKVICLAEAWRSAGCGWQAFRITLFKGRISVTAVFAGAGTTANSRCHRPGQGAGRLSARVA
jgi:hypothetical protein